MSQDMDTSKLPVVGDFTLAIDGNALTITNIAFKAGSQRVLELTTDTAIGDGNLTLGYTASTANAM
jgi:hypothetical protein